MSRAEESRVEEGQCMCGLQHATRLVEVHSGSLLHRVLNTVVYCTCDRAAVEASKYPYRLVEYTVPSWNLIAFEYHLTVLGVLHRWFGLVVWEGDA